MAEPDREARVACDRVRETIIAALDAKHLRASEGVRLAGLLDNDQRRQAIRIREVIAAERLGERARSLVRPGVVHELCKGLSRELADRSGGRITVDRLKRGDCRTQGPL